MDITITSNIAQNRRVSKHFVFNVTQHIANALLTYVTSNHRTFEPYYFPDDSRRLVISSKHEQYNTLHHDET